MTQQEWDNAVEFQFERLLSENCRWAQATEGLVYRIQEEAIDWVTDEYGERPA